MINTGLPIIPNLHAHDCDAPFPPSPFSSPSYVLADCVFQTKIVCIPCHGTTNKMVDSILWKWLINDHSPSESQDHDEACSPSQCSAFPADNLAALLSSKETNMKLNMPNRWAVLFILTQRHDRHTTLYTHARASTHTQTHVFCQLILHK